MRDKSGSETSEAAGIELKGGQQDAVSTAYSPQYMAAADINERPNPT
jgi:hypothetical protein